MRKLGVYRFGGRGGFASYKHFGQKGVTHGQRKHGHKNGVYEAGRPDRSCV